MKTTPTRIACLLLVGTRAFLSPVDEFAEPVHATPGRVAIPCAPAASELAPPAPTGNAAARPAAQAAENKRAGAFTFNQPPSAEGGKNCVVFVNQEVIYDGWGCSANDVVVEYSWDFESDGVIDFASSFTGATSHRFAQEGEYRSVLTVRDTAGKAAQAVRRVTVVSTEAARRAAEARLRPALAGQPNPADGILRRYAVLFNGGGDARYWTDMTLAYAMLTERYAFTPEDIFILNEDGTNPDGQNPMVDSAATLQDLQTVFTTLAAITDADDELIFFITDHGRGYIGPLDKAPQFQGYLDGRASLDPGDEPDFPESDFKLRSLFTAGDFASNHGLDVWKVYQKSRSSTATTCFRNKFVSHFQNVSVAGLGLLSDNDVFIERFVDYLQGDTDRDGTVDTALGEKMDYDGDGVPPYDPSTGAFDEGDWGEIDGLEDNFNNINCGVPVGGRPYRVFDEDLKGKLCIDLAHDGTNLQVDGRDEDGQGLFDWMDANQDGDTNDIISVDETVCAGSENIYDDDLRALFNLLSLARITIVAEPCFSGGLVEDLSGPRRVICTATMEEARSWGDGFIRGFVAALHGRKENGFPVHCDTNGDGQVSMLEAFNYASATDPFDEIPQYDDNGDGISQTGPVPAGGDGSLGADTFLSSPPAVVTIAATDGTAGEPGSGQGTGTLTFTRTGSTAAALAVNIAVDGTATSGLDYTSLGTSFSFSPGSANATIDVSVLDDTEPEGEETVVVTLTSGGDYTIGTPTSAATVRIVDDDIGPVIVGRYVFYNNSAFDGETVAASEADDAAIATDKSPLKAGSAAAFGNYTSYLRGINGIMIDVTELAGTPAAADFIFRMGNDNSPAEWPAAPPPLDISVRDQAGVSGSDRLTLIWADNAVCNTWLEVTVLPTPNTGLKSADVFYFGNAVGECGDNAADAIINVSDVAMTRANPRSPLDPAMLNCPFDYDRDGLVNVTDVALARANQTSPLTALRLITPPVPASGAGPATMARNPSLQRLSKAGPVLSYTHLPNGWIRLECEASQERACRLEVTDHLGRTPWTESKARTVVGGRGSHRQWELEPPIAGRSQFYRVVWD